MGIKLIGIIVNETTPKIAESEICFTTRGSDCHRGGGIVVVLSKCNRSDPSEWIQQVRNARSKE